MKRLDIVLAWLAAIGAPVLADEAPEPVPELQASQLLPAELRTAPGCEVVEAVANDGMMNRYRITGRWGEFDAYGRAELVVRLHECAALAELDDVSSSDVFLEAAGRAVTAPFEVAGGLVTNPIGTVTGIPAGIGRLFESYSYHAKEAARAASRQIESAGESGAGAAASAAGTAAEDAAVRYARSYLGVSDAERRWYAKLAVDPYTRNAPLREAVRRVAKVDATASFGMGLAIPSVPGLGEVRRTMDLVWKEDPVLVRKRNRKLLGQLGFDEDAIGRFEDNAWLSPTRQALVIDAVRQLKGVAGREHLVARAMDVAGDDEAAVLVRSIVMLVALHEGEAPLEAVLPGIRFPVARARSGRLLATAALDGLHWTEAVAKAAPQLSAVYAAEKATVRELWIAAPASERFRREAAARGWEVRTWSPSVRSTAGAAPISPARGVRS